MKKVKELKKWIELYNEVHAAAEELQLAYDYVKEGIVSEEEVDEAYGNAIQLVESLEFRNMLRQEADQMSCVLKINSGAGGTESQDWASMLLRMYTRWAEANGYKISVANYQEGDEAGIKTATLNIEGDYAYGYLKGENGVHRLVRVSPYNFKDPYTGEEEEILIENTETRDQPKNRENAMRQLRSILYDKELQHRMEEQAKVEAGKKKIEWGSQIRSYVFDDRRVKDHRTNFQTSDVNGVMDGKIDDFIKAYLMEFGAEESAEK